MTPQKERAALAGGPNLSSNNDELIEFSNVQQQETALAAVLRAALLVIRQALVAAVEAIDGYLCRRRGTAARPLRGEVYTCECRDAQGRTLWLVVHESKHHGNSVVLGQYDNRLDAEAAAALEAGRLGAVRA